MDIDKVLEDNLTKIVVPVACEVYHSVGLTFHQVSTCCGIRDLIRLHTCKPAGFAI